MAVAKKKTAPKAAKKESSAAKTSTTTKFKDFVISKKRSGRYEVLNAKGKNVNGMDKAKILVEAKLVQAGFPKAGGDEAAPSEAAST